MLNRENIFDMMISRKIGNEKRQAKNLKYLLVLIFSSVSFLNPMGILPESLCKITFYLCCVIGLIISCRGKQLNRMYYPKNMYILLLGGMFISSFMPTLFKAQTSSETWMTYLPYIFSYVTFIIFLKADISQARLERIIRILSVVGTCVYVLNFISFPNIIFGVERDEYDIRTIVRLDIPFLPYIVVNFFMSINKWVADKNKKELFWILGSYAMIVLSLTRQYMLWATVLGVFFVMTKVSTFKKVLVSLFLLFCFYAILPNIPIFSDLMELSQEQADKNKYQQDDIRIQAWRYYTIEHQTNDVTRFFGNGIPAYGKSVWGKKYMFERDMILGGNGYYTTDVGWAGFYWYFGLFTLIGLIILIIKCILRNNNVHIKYVSYSLLFFVLISFTSGPILYKDQILALCFVLAMGYKFNFLTKTKINSYGQNKI